MGSYIILDEYKSEEKKKLLGLVFTMESGKELGRLNEETMPGKCSDKRQHSPWQANGPSKRFRIDPP